MMTILTPQQRMDAAFDNYFALSHVLREDLIAILETESNSQHWRRNYVRVSASLIEGYTHCLREMCLVCTECFEPDISKKEAKVILSEQSFNANERFKRTLRAAYKLFDELESKPDFGGPEWRRAQRFFETRHQLMHPKTSDDLEISNEIWPELRDDATWLIEQIFNFIASLLTKHNPVSYERAPDTIQSS